MADRIVIYFNFDGFAYYYYQIAHERNLIPFIDFLIANGVFFENCYTGIPAITNPMQCAISSGCYSGRTKNVKIYYDKETRTIISQKRENRAENIINCLQRQGIKCGSIHHFTFEDNGTVLKKEASPYVFYEGASFAQRFEMLKNLLTGKRVPSGDDFIKASCDIRFIAVYFDDLDTIGHNNGKLAPIARCEKDRIENVIWRLSQLDRELEKFFDFVESIGLGDALSCFFLTDHGMTPFTFNEGSLANYNDLLSTLNSYTYEILSPGMKASEETQIVLTSAGLSLLLSFTEKYPNREKLNHLKTVLLGKSYVGMVLDRYELMEDGAMDFCDLYISPRVPYIFKDNAPRIGANHDSLDDTSMHIFSLMYGNGIKKGVKIARKVRNIDFASTMTKVLNANPPENNCVECVLEALL